MVSAETTHTVVLIVLKVATGSMEMNRQGQVPVKLDQNSW